MLLNMAYQNSHIFSQGGNLSQLSGGFPQEKDAGMNEGEEYNLQETGQDKTMSSRAEAICEENRQINRLVELSLKQLEKKRINLMNKEKALNEEIVKLLETQKRQSEQNLDLQMKIEEWSTKHQEELKLRPLVIEKLKQVDGFINKYEHNFGVGIAAVKSIEEGELFLQSEFDNIRKKSRTTQENLSRMKESVVDELQEKANKCKGLRETILKDRAIMIDNIQKLAFQNEESLSRINEIQEEIEKIGQKKEALTKSLDLIVGNHEALNGSIAKMYQELNETKMVGASRIQHLKLQLNTEENIKCNLETKLKDKEESLHGLTTKVKEVTNLSNQMKNAVDKAEKYIEKKVKDIELYKNKIPVVSNQATSLRETLKQYENVEKDNNFLKNNISLLEDEIKLNINILSEKENVLSDLSNKMKELEEKLSVLEENKFEQERELENIRVIEHQLSSSIDENKMLYQQDREEKLAQNESLRQKNAQLDAEIAECIMKLKELEIFNDSAADKEKDIKCLIEECKETVKINETKFIKEEEEEIKLMESYNEKINDMMIYLDRNKCFILEAEPKQQELSMMLKKKESLEQEIKMLTENNQNKISALKNTHTAKIMEMDSEMEKHSSIMKNIQLATEDSTNKLKEEIKAEEKTKIKLENILRALQLKLKTLKNEEIMKRNKIAKMEKRQHKIMNELKVTREDIAQAVAGKELPVPLKRTTPSSIGSSQSLYGKVAKKVDGKENKLVPELANPDLKQEHTRKWVESVPDDEYDFSEI